MVLEGRLGTMESWARIKVRKLAGV